MIYLIFFLTPPPLSNEILHKSQNISLTEMKCCCALNISLYIQDDIKKFANKYMHSLEMHANAAVTGNKLVNKYVHEFKLYI